MKLKEIRKYLFDNYKCVKDVRISDVMNINTLEPIGSRINVYLDNMVLYEPEWLIELKNKIGADDCYVTIERNRLKAMFNIRNQLKGE